MTYPLADEEQEIDMALRAAAYRRWVELREQRKPETRNGMIGYGHRLWAKSCARSTAMCSGWTVSLGRLFRTEWTDGRRNTDSLRDLIKCDKTSTRL
jgi:hypothetical protein